jgi:uncharacterized protein
VRRAVVDPNVLISAYLSPAGATAELYRLALDGRFQPVACPQLLDELQRVLTTSRHLKRYRDPARIQAFVAAFEATVELHPDPVEIPPASRDPADDYLLALAQATGAPCVSGDADLTSEGLAITPRAFLELLIAEAWD